VLSALILVGLVASSSTNDLPQSDRRKEACTVVLRCSSGGVACPESDRACQDDARSRGLELLCEGPDARFVYCPVNGRNESPIVWLLLSVAGVIAVFGSTLAWLLLRKPRAAGGDVR
jgi:hypothetical protein